MTNTTSFLYGSHEEAEAAIRAFFIVMPALIVECAKDIHSSWADSGKPKIDSEAALMERVEKIVREHFRSDEDAA